MLALAALAPRMFAQAGYVDSRLCVSCHGEIARKYRATAMGRSFSRPALANTSEDFSRRNVFAHTLSGSVYAMLERGGEYFERRSQTGFDGKPTNIAEKRIDFIIGSGDHARTYLHREPDGRLLELPVSWYAEKGGFWAMSPGYDRAGQDDFRRGIPYDCMFCHNAYPRAPISEDGGGHAVFPAELPEGIDCERCHGPGKAHIEAASLATASREAIRRAIVNPARLTRDRQLEVCMQCHLETTSRRLPNSIRRFERAPYSYRPGEPLGDYMIYFDRAPGSGHEDDFEVAHAAYRLRKSACFLKSDMTCTTCHDPHDQQRGAAAAERYTAACRRCHATAHSSDSKISTAQASGCLDCHMPKRRAEDAVHVVMTDHYIRRSLPDRDLLAPIAEADEKPWRGDVVEYYPQRLAHTGENDLYLAVAQVRDGANLERGIPQLRDSIAKYRPARAEFYFELGAAYGQTGRNKEAIEWYREALRRRPDYRDALVKLTEALVTAGDLTQAARVAEKALAAHPNDESSQVNLANILLQQGNPAEAERTLDGSLKLEPDDAEAENVLGLVKLKRSESHAAEAAFREAIRIDPGLAEAHNNLGNILAGRRDFREAGFHFQKAMESNPSFIEAWRSYSLILGLSRDLDGAIATLRKGLTFVPDSAEAHLDLGDLLVARGQPGDAEREYRAAIRIKPALAEAQLQLGLMLVRSSRAEEGREHLRVAAQSSDPEIRKAALAALK